MRLTEKRNGIYDKDNVLSNGMPRLDLKEYKLSQLEDIEEELGIDLITLYSLFKQKKIWVYENDNKKESDKIGINLYDKVLIASINYSHTVTYQFKDYGKTWALTKEELK